VSSLDGHAPLVLNVRELGRRAGAMTTVQLTCPAPVDLLNPMIAVPVDSDIELDLMLESVIEGVLVSGTATALTQGACSRCLEQIAGELEVSIQELFRYRDLEQLSEEDEELPTFDGDSINLEPTLRDAVVLALPLAPVCREDCLGLCPECGARLADDPNHQHDQTDPRWAGLAEMFGQQSRDTDRGPETKG